MKTALKHFEKVLDGLKADGLCKNERIIVTPQSGRIDTDRCKNLINMCSNNYLGLADHKLIEQAAKESFDKWGYGLSSVRFICGTQQIHKDLEHSISDFLKTEDTILYSSCFDANGGLFEPLLGEQDCIISDSLNHASIIDGIRLCKAKRLKYANNDMADLERCLKEAQTSRIKIIATDGVFSMDGIIADLKSICNLAERYDALVMVDDSHAVGFMGDTGRGTPEYCGVMGKVDIITGTLGKALGGASGGYTSGRKEVVDLLRQKSRPYLFSNTLAPSLVCGALKTFELCRQSTALRDKVHENTAYYREKLKAVGLDIIESTHPIVAVMFYDAHVASQVAEKMLALGVYVIGFTYPVVPQGKARIRTQVSAAHAKTDLDYVVDCFRRVKAEMRI